MRDNQKYAVSIFVDRLNALLRRAFSSLTTALYVAFTGFSDYRLFSWIAMISLNSSLTTALYVAFNTGRLDG